MSQKQDLYFPYKFRFEVITKNIMGIKKMSETNEPTNTTAIATKKFWQSKTFWVNLISAIALVVQTKTGFVIDPATQAIALTVINGALRAATKSAITLS